MKISIGSDHRGIDIKDLVANYIRELGHEVLNEGPCAGETMDYPDMAAIVAKKVSTGEVDRGVLLCGTGIGMSITANKFAHVRAAVCWDEATARLSREHNNANVLCTSGDVPTDSPAREARLNLLRSMVLIWLTTDFAGGRHARRVDKISEVEQACGLHT